MAYRIMIKSVLCEDCAKINALYVVHNRHGRPIGNYCEVCSQKKVTDLKKFEENEGPGWA